MKNIILFLIVILMLPILGDASPRKSKSQTIQEIRHYQRLMESAQPQPTIKHYKSSGLPSIMAEKSKSAIFLNVNTIDDESAFTFRMQNESSISVNPTNPMNLIASSVDYRDNSATWVYVSHDGGKSWINHNLGRPYPGWRSSNDPSVYFALDGTGYLCYGGFGTNIDSFTVSVGENGVFVAKTIDEGHTWKAHIPVIVHKGLQTLDSLFEDKYYVQVDNSPVSPYFGHVYIPWKRVTPRDSATQIVISKSIDKGETWSIPKEISHRVSGSSEDTTFGQSFPLAATGPNGELYVVWNHGIVHGIGFVKSFDGGETFTEPKIIKNYEIFGTTTYIEGQGWRHTVKEKVRAEAYPVIVCDITEGERRGTLYLCWAADNVPNIYFSKSTDMGETWTERVIVHSDTTNDQFWPWMAVDALSGDIAIMYFDSRNCPDNLMVECYVSYSPDGGDTWVDRRAADQMSDLRLNPFRGNAFAGDYSGCAFYNGIIYPTWVDMRSSVLNIMDSDVFTAIINTQAPMPVENFKVDIIAEQPTTLNLTWENPTKRSFGQPLSDEDYKIIIKRDDGAQFILDGGTDTFEDIDLTPYQKYTYDIATMAAGDTSNSRFDFSYAGGSKEPGTPKILKSAGNNNYVANLSVLLPNKRADRTTPLANLDKIAIYRDGNLIKYESVMPSDTGAVVNFSDETYEEGFYLYSVAAIDQYGNASELSEQILAYSGEVRYYSDKLETFDSKSMPRYYISGNWQRTDEASVTKPSSLSNAPFEKYENNQNDTLIIFPFVTNGKDYYLSFYHAALIANNDFGTVEYSTNGGLDWSNDFDGVAARWTKSAYPAWSDNIFDENDWKFEELKLPNTTDTIYVRWVFYANPLINDLGWYIDDIRLADYSVSVADNQEQISVKVFPNPAKDVIKVIIPESASGNYSYSIYSAVGNKAISGEMTASSFGEVLIPVSNLTSGAYYLYIYNQYGTVYKENILIIK